MRGKPKKSPRYKDMTSDYLAGSLDEDRIDPQQRFTQRSKDYQKDKTQRTATMRLDDSLLSADIETLPIGQVIQVFSVYCDVEHEGRTHLCVVRKTLSKVHGDIVVGDRVRFRLNPPGPEALPAPAGWTPDQSLHARSPDGVIEQVLPRATLLTRADSFKAISSHAIVANAQQVLIVASLLHPKPKWGLIDRMIVAARAGELQPIICLNKIDLADLPKSEVDFARSVIAHYATIDIITLETSVEQNCGIDILRDLLKNRTTVLAGHSGVGKSSLIRAIQPSLDLRVGEVSKITEKGRHTTTSAKYYPLDMGGAVIDTPGVKLFGLWNVTSDNLLEFFPDVGAGSAPDWRMESFHRITESLSG